MASQTDICNFALSHLGVGKIITSVTEASQEARVCNLFYDSVRDHALRDFPWPFTKRRVTLGLIETDPNDDWDYSYRLPHDIITVRRVVSGVRNDTISSRVEYEILSDEDGGILYTDMQDAEIEYTSRITDVTKYPPDFVMALSFFLAHHIAPRISGSDAGKLGQRALQMYAIEISRAATNASNETPSMPPQEAELITGRN